MKDGHPFTFTGLTRIVVSCIVLGCIRGLPGQRNVDRTYSNCAAFHKMKGFYWLLILLLLSVGQIESVQAAPASPNGAEPRFPKPVEEYHDEQIPGITAKLVQRIQAEPFNLVGTLDFPWRNHSHVPCFQIPSWSLLYYLG
jgi:hypothetical protein